ncbi:hypothetical protein EGW08_004518 [Elysia chlorotica]|uniref:DNA helicase n=1 Tax=Elysia chlorotica TaxID=188477 RepID=A0A433U1J6_ELYCH|nr:hypothetical protein EGW08_004518 [Elysia chlorotica]
MAVEEFVHKTLDLLDKEREAEIQETQTLFERLSAKELERKGVCLRKLQLRSHRSGLYGRMVAVFEPEAKHRGKNVKQELPSSNITPGDIVGVGLTSSDPTEKPLTSGIVLQVSAFNISVAFDESQDILDLDDTASYKLTKLANDVTYRRLKGNLNDLLKYRDGPARRLIDTLFCLQEISGPGGEFSFKFVNERLDESQREAVKFALTQREVAIIHGPPGTGKTTTVVEIILQSVAQGLKVLVTAPSNIAVDNLLERLASNRTSPRLVRLGHPARLMPHLTKFSLDAIVSAAEESDIVRDVRTDIQKTLTKMKKARGSGERKALRDELKHLRKEVSQREERATAEVLSRAQVVLSTLTTASVDGPLKHMADKAFDLVVIDECSQALEAACWIGLLRGQRCILAGDHLQLPPTIMSREAASGGLELTLMERLLETLVQEKERDIVRMLTTQYRMHQDIMEWASHQLYQGKLTAHPSVAAHLLKDIEGVSDTEETRVPLLLIDTAGCDLRELDLPEDVSKGNEGEADIVAAHVENLIKAGVKPIDIAVIAPYNMQVDLLRDRLCSQHPGLEVKSVDGFQGREKEAVVISMVRSNTTAEVGFLSEKRRINVAVTRARRHLAVICDSDTVCHDPFIASLVNYMTEHGDVLSADQVLQIQEHKRDLLETSDRTSNDALEPTSSLSSCQSNHVNYSNIECCDISKELKSNVCLGNSSSPSNADSDSNDTDGHFTNNDGVGQTKKQIPEDTSTCPNCQKSIPVLNKTLHQLHCSRQNRRSTAPVNRNDMSQTSGAGGGAGGKGARKKENLKKPDSQPVKEKKEKVKPKTSHVQKASEVLSKIPDDDFDALISTITALDGKCAFRKCKTLTTTLGRQCVLCDRRFCLAHLTPEVHGCGQAAKDQARRTISREGVLHSGSGVPDKKPNAVRRAQLEIRMDKKKEELAKARARQGDKKKS